METQILESPTIVLDSPVDDSRPFRSVKEAVAIFGDRLFSPPKFSFDKDTPNSITPSPTIDSSVVIQSPVKTPTSPKLSRFALERQASDSSLITQSPYNSGKQSIVLLENNEQPKPSPRSSDNEIHNGNVVHGNDLVMMLMVLKKLEADLQEAKMELKLLKERELETEIALASLNAELHKNMSKMAKSEATAAAAVAKSTMGREGEKRDTGKGDGEKERMEMMIKSLDSPTLAQILSISDYERYFGGSKRNSSKLMKKKPVIPLVTDFFLWKKKSTTNNDHLSPLFPSHMYSA